MARDPKFQRGKDDAFQAWWQHGEYAPRSEDTLYLDGYDVGWELASDPLHEDSHDPQLDPDLRWSEVHGAGRR